MLGCEAYMRLVWLEEVERQLFNNETEEDETD